MASDPSQDASRTEEFVLLLGRHERELIGYILSLVADWNVVEDLAQETRVRLWRQFDQYDPEKDFGAWARTIAHYQVLQYRTRCERDRLQFQDDILEKVADAAAERMSGKSERLAALAYCLQKLTEVQQAFLRRIYAGKESMRDIAKEQGRSYTSTRQSVVRLRRNLRICIEEQLATGKN